MAGASIKSTPWATAMAVALVTLTMTVGQTEAQADGTGALMTCIDEPDFVSFLLGFRALSFPRRRCTRTNACGTRCTGKSYGALPCVAGSEADSMPVS